MNASGRSRSFAVLRRGLVPGGVVLALIAVLAAPACQLVLPFASGDERDEAQCTNGRDDDADGAIDCADLGCSAFCSEQTPALCRNGIDDDESGAADCDDPKCDGMCREEAPERCNDGRDQDGDGLIDLDDPSCWPDASTRVERCTSQRGGRWVATFGGEDDGWSSEGAGTPTYVPDPAGRFAHPILSLPAGADVTNGAIVTGGIDGLRWTTSVYLAPDGWVDLAIESPLLVVAAPRAPQRLAVILTTRAIVADLQIDGVQHGDFVTTTRSAGWYDVDVRVDAAEVTVHVGVPGRSGGEQLSFAHPGDLSSSAGYRLRAGSPSGMLLAAAEISRPFVDPCEYEVPAETDSDYLSDYLAVAATPDIVCAIGYDDRFGLSAVSHRSEDGGRTFGPPSSVVISTGDGMGGLGVASPCLSLAYDPAARELVGLAHSFTRHAESKNLVRSRDCVEWTVEPVAAPDAWPASRGRLPGCATYSVVGGRHELWMADVDSEGIRLERWWAERGFRPDETPHHDEPLRVAPTGQGWVQVSALGGDLLLAGSAADRFEVTVVDRILHEPRPWLSIPPTRIEGACDAAGLGRAAVFLAGRSTGGVAHPCRGALNRSRTVVLPFDVSAPQ